MYKAQALGCRGASGLAQNCIRAACTHPAVSSHLSVQHRLSRACLLRCNALLRPTGSSSARPGRRRAVVCHAAAKSFYEILGVTQSATDKDIKSAYRKLAMKLHPDVNKAPDAQKRFMEVKVAYETLSDAKQRAEYDRRLRMGGFGSAGSRAGAGYGSSSAGFGGASSSAGWGSSYGSYGGGTNFTQEPVPGLDDLLRDLEKEFTAWANQRAKDSKTKTLLEELEDLGGEFLDFLEESLGIKDEQPAAGSANSTRGSSSGGGEPCDARSAAERFDAYWRQYGEGQAPGSGSASGGATSSRSSTAGTGAATGSTGRSTAGASSAASTSSGSSAGTPRQPPKQSLDDDIEAQLQALKKKLNKL